MLDMACNALRSGVTRVHRHLDAFDLAIEQHRTAEHAAWDTLVGDLEAVFEHAPIIVDEFESNSAPWINNRKPGGRFSFRRVLTTRRVGAPSKSAAMD
jgi:hypothetical protein